jgi:carbamoyltransferase
MLETVRGYGDRVTVVEWAEDEVAARTAELLSEKVVVGWFQGRAEYGPRALGARSILANPMFDDIKDIINLRVKHREPFRPFAPMVLESAANELFEMGKLPISPFMTFVVPVREEYREKIPGATHVDGTSRVQTVSDEQNPLVADLLREVERTTGVPCLINTSFNVAGEPIVCSPADAVNCFLGTEIDCLVLGRLLIRKA